jgi:hypothetical protein
VNESSLSWESERAHELTLKGFFGNMEHIFDGV